MKRLYAWITSGEWVTPREWLQLFSLAAAVILALAIIVVVIIGAHQHAHACRLLDIAQDEAQMAEAWHIEAGIALERCGIKGAKEKAESKACYARRFNDDSVVCE